MLNFVRFQFENCLLVALDLACFISNAGKHVAWLLNWTLAFGIVAIVMAF